MWAFHLLVKLFIVCPMYKSLYMLHAAAYTPQFLQFKFCLNYTKLRNKRPICSSYTQ